MISPNHRVTFPMSYLKLGIGYRGSMFYPYAPWLSLTECVTDYELPRQANSLSRK
jgi:hypothetical protein